jgi:ATP/maltotriose-dependent transcriptional regulator MalT
MLDFDEAAATAPEWYTAVDDALGLGHYEEAGRLARDALLMAEDDPVAKAMAALANAKVSMAKSDPRSAKRKVDDALKFAKQLGDKKVEAAALHRSAKIALESGADNAIDQATEALNLYTSVSDDIGVASVKATLGKATLPLDMEQARDYANEASHIFTASSEKKGQAAALHVLFSLMLRTGRLNNATVLVGEMERCYRIAGDVPNASTCQLLAAQVLLSAGKFKDALEVAQAVKRLAEGLGDEKKQAAAAYMMASTMDASGRLKDAEAAAYDAWSLMRNVRDKAGMASALEVMASCLAKKKQYSSAVQKLEEASSLYRQLKDVRMEAKILKKREEVLIEEMISKGEITKPKPNPKDKQAPIKEFMDVYILRSQFDGKTHKYVDWDEHESRVAAHMAQGGGEDAKLDVAKLGSLNRPSPQEVLYDVQWKSLTKGALIDLPTPLDEPILA